MAQYLFSSESRRTTTAQPKRDTKQNVLQTNLTNASATTNSKVPSAQNSKQKCDPAAEELLFTGTTGHEVVLKFIFPPFMLIFLHSARIIRCRLLQFCFQLNMLSQASCRSRASQQCGRVRRKRVDRGSSNVEGGEEGATIGIHFRCLFFPFFRERFRAPLHSGSPSPDRANSSCNRK